MIQTLAVTKQGKKIFLAKFQFDQHDVGVDSEHMQVHWKGKSFPIERCEQKLQEVARKALNIAIDRHS